MCILFRNPKTIPRRCEAFWVWFRSNLRKRLEIMPRKYSDEFKGKAARQAIEMIRPWNATQGQACKHISTLLGIWSDTLRNWVRNHPDRPSHTTTGKHTGGESPEQELARLRKKKTKSSNGQTRS